MAILYGTSGGVREIGEAGTRHCEHCDQDTAFTALVRYAYFHIWYLFCFVFRKDYYLRCASCSSVVPTDVKTVREHHANDNIPFLHRNGGLVILGLISVILFATTIQEKSDAKKMDAFIAAPQVNDIYTADLAVIPDSGFGVDNLNLGPSTKAFGTMKLLRIEGNLLFFASSSKAYEKLRDMEKDRRKLVYDTDTAFALTADEVKELRRTGVIIEVRR